MSALSSVGGVLELSTAAATMTVPHGMMNDIRKTEDGAFLKAAPSAVCKGMLGGDPSSPAFRRQRASRVSGPEERPVAHKAAIQTDELLRPALHFASSAISAADGVFTVAGPAYLLKNDDYPAGAKAPISAVAGDPSVSVSGTVPVHAPSSVDPSYLYGTESAAFQFLHPQSSSIATLDSGGCFSGTFAPSHFFQQQQLQLLQHHVQHYEHLLLQQQLTPQLQNQSPGSVYLQKDRLGHETPLAEDLPLVQHSRPGGVVLSDHSESSNFASFSNDLPDAESLSRSRLSLYRQIWDS